MDQLKYSCEICVFNTQFKNRYTSHINSNRHKQKLNTASDLPVFTHLCNNCNKSFKSNSGLWSHKSKCLIKKKDKVEVVDIEMKDSINELKTMIVDIKTKYPQQILSNTYIENQNNQINNNINFNLILNQNFTNGMNFIDMINTMEIDKSYQNTITSENYVKKVFLMIKNALEKLPIEQRPIQCIKGEDDHQQIIHIRHNNQWNKETEIEWTEQIHNFYLDDGDEAAPEDEKIIFNCLKKLEEHITEELGKVANPNTQREYSYEVCHPPNKIKIIKSLLEYINIEKNDLIDIINNVTTNV